jgi:DNA methylase/ParB-like nuclease family protein
MKYDEWPIDHVKPYEKNPRKIPQAAIDKVACSIAEYGWQQPIVVDACGVIIAGHVRLLAARKLGLTDVPVQVAENLTPAQVRGYRLMDNRSNQETDWFPALLKSEIVELDAIKFSLNFTGFERREIDELLVNEELDEQADAGPSGSSKIITKLGDLWQCGPHRVLCGDATDAASVSRVLGDTQPLLMVTDQPFGSAYDPAWREEAGLGAAVQVGKVANDDRVDWTAAYLLFPGDVVYLWHGGLHAAEVQRSLETAGFEIRSQVIWAKQHFVISRGMMHWQHEPCWVAVRKGRRSHWRGDRTQSTLWSVANLNPFGGSTDEARTGHGCQKPTSLFRRPILNHTERGDVIYDPFLGSGSCVQAAQLTGRICYGLDIEPKYVDCIVRRWQDLTGRPATLEGDGSSFDEIKTLRLSPSAQ